MSGSEHAGDAQTERERWAFVEDRRREGEPGRDLDRSRGSVANDHDHPGLPGRARQDRPFADGLPVRLRRRRRAGAGLRTIEVRKLRGGAHLGGAHDYAIAGDGFTVHPRLESVLGGSRPPESWAGLRGLSTGVPGLDAMLGGGLLPRSSTLVMGTPGTDKTLLGLSFLLEGIAHGERGCSPGSTRPNPT